MAPRPTTPSRRLQRYKPIVVGPGKTSYVLAAAAPSDGSPSNATARGRNKSAKTTSTTPAPAAGTSQIALQSCVTLRHSRAAAAASVHASFGVANRLTTAPDTNAPTKYPRPFVTKLIIPCAAA